MERKARDKVIAYLCYTLGFVALATMIVSIFYAFGKSMVYNSDALVQHYPTHFYLRHFMSELLNGTQKFNFNIGLGQDVLFTYHYYGLTDPLNILLGVFSWLDPNITYSLSLVLRMYIAGLAFVAMCIYFKKSTLATVLGALFYVFSNFSLGLGLLYPYFETCMIYLPLMIVGVNLLIRKNKVLFFIVISFLSIISNVYFAYIISALTFVYAIVTIITNCRENGVIEIFRIFGRGIISYLIAAMISGFVIIPLAYGFINSTKNIDMTYNIPWLVDKTFAINYFASIFQAPNINNCILLGISIATLFALVSLFTRRGDTRLKILSLMMIGLIIVPKLQSAVTGFSYDNFRWYFAVELLMAYIFVNEFDRLMDMSKKRKLVVFSISGLYLIIYLYQFIRLDSILSLDYSNIEFLKNMSLLLMAIVLMVSLGLSKKVLKKVSFSILAILVLVSNLLIYSYDTVYDKNILSFRYLEHIINDRDFETLANTTKGTFERVDNEDPQSSNLSDIYGYPSSSIYYSIENKNLYNFNRLYRNSKATPITRMNNFDGRSILDDIMSVKYFKSFKYKRAPYGFDQTPMENIYINKNYIPFGFTYENYIKPYEVASMSTLDRQEALLHAVIINSDISSVKHLDSGVLSDINLRKTDLDYRLSKNTNNKGYLLEFDIPYNGEVYLKIDDYRAIKGTEDMYVELDGKGRRIDFIKPTSKNYYEEKDLVVNMGYAEKGKRQIKIKLSPQAQFHKSNITLECRPVDMIAPASKELAKEHLKEIRIQSDGFTGNITNTGYKMMFISIPYDDGWTAIIDGVNSKIYRANEGFMAVKLEPGEHTVKFVYNRPFQTVGYIISGLGLLLFIIYIVRRKKSSQKKRLEMLKNRSYEQDNIEDEERE